MHSDAVFCGTRTISRKGEKGCRYSPWFTWEPRARFPLVLCLIFAILPPRRNGCFFCGKGSVPVERFRNLTSSFSFFFPFFFLFFFFFFCIHLPRSSLWLRASRQQATLSAARRRYEPAALPARARKPPRQLAGLGGRLLPAARQGSPHPSCQRDESC